MFAREQVYHWISNYVSYEGSAKLSNEIRIWLRFLGLTTFLSAWLSFSCEQERKRYEPFTTAPPTLLFPFLQSPFCLLQSVYHREKKKISRSANSHRVFSHGGIGKVSKPIPPGVCWFSLRAMQSTFLPCLTGLKLCLGCNKFQPYPHSSSCNLIQLRDI